MKISKQLLGAIGVGIIACLLIAGTILALHQPIVWDNGWNGTQPLSTTTLTSTFFPPAPGWSKYIVETPVLPTRTVMFSFTTWTLSPEGTPFPTWSPHPPGIPTDTPTSQP